MRRRRGRGPGLRRAGLPSCGSGRLRPWGRGRQRVIRLRDGARARLSPLRGRCGSCAATHIVLPSWMASRRADAVGVIAAAAVASARGTAPGRRGSGRPGRRRARLAARPGRRDASGRDGHLRAADRGPLRAVPEPSGSPLGDALSAVAACAHAAITFCGRAAADWEPLLGLFGLARYLAPAPGN